MGREGRGEEGRGQGPCPAGLLSGAGHRSGLRGGEDGASPSTFPRSLGPQEAQGEGGEGGPVLGGRGGWEASSLDPDPWHREIPARHTPGWDTRGPSAPTPAPRGSPGLVSMVNVQPLFRNRPHCPRARKPSCRACQSHPRQGWHSQPCSYLHGHTYQARPLACPAPRPPPWGSHPHPHPWPHSLGEPVA